MTQAFPHRNTAQRGRERVQDMVVTHFIFYLSKNVFFFLSVKLKMQLPLLPTIISIKMKEKKLSSPLSDLHNFHRFIISSSAINHSAGCTFEHLVFPPPRSIADFEAEFDYGDVSHENVSFFLSLLLRV